MRRALVSLAILAVFALGTSGASAGPQPFAFGSGMGSGQRTAWVAQQDNWPQPVAFIRNPLLPACLWSVDDHVKWGPVAGFLEPGATASASYCLVSDFNPVYATRNGTTAWWSMAGYGYFGLSILTSESSHVVSVCYSPQGRCFPVAATWDAAFRAWRWEFCGRASYAPDDPALDEIAGSNGGRGVVTSVNVSITNTGARRSRSVTASTGISSDVTFPVGCGMPDQSEYPFSWTL